jgi:hypothetical protein
MIFMFINQEIIGPVYLMDLGTMFDFFKFFRIPTRVRMLERYEVLLVDIAEALFSDNVDQIINLFRSQIDCETTPIQFEKRLLSLTKLFLDFGFLKAFDKDGQSKINWAFILDHPQIMRFFAIDKRINLKEHMDAFVTALIAYPKGREIFLEDLLKEYAKDIEDFFLVNIIKGNKEIVYSLWNDSGLKPALNIASAIEVATQFGQPEMVELFLKNFEFKTTSIKKALLEPLPRVSTLSMYKRASVQSGSTIYGRNCALF